MKYLFSFCIGLIKLIKTKQLSQHLIFNHILMFFPNQMILPVLFMSLLKLHNKCDSKKAKQKCNSLLFTIL